MVAVLFKTPLTVVLPSSTWNEMRVTEPIASGWMAVQLIVLSAVLRFKFPLVAAAEFATKLLPAGIVSVAEAFDAVVVPSLSRLSA
jgi:hypothetical protein